MVFVLFLGAACQNASMWNKNNNSTSAALEPQANVHLSRSIRAGVSNIRHDPRAWAWVKARRTVFGCRGKPCQLVIPALLISVTTRLQKNQFFNRTHTGITSAAQHARDGILSTMTHSYYLTPLRVVKHKPGYPHSYTLPGTLSSYFQLILFSDKHHWAVRA